MRLTCKEKKALRYLKEAHNVYCKKNVCATCNLDREDSNCLIEFAKLIIEKEGYENGEKENN